MAGQNLKAKHVKVMIHAGLAGAEPHAWHQLAAESKPGRQCDLSTWPAMHAPTVNSILSKCVHPLASSVQQGIPHSLKPSISACGDGLTSHAIIQGQRGFYGVEGKPQLPAQAKSPQIAAAIFRTRSRYTAVQASPQCAPIFAPDPEATAAKNVWEQAVPARCCAYIFLKGGGRANRIAMTGCSPADARIEAAVGRPG